MAVNPCLSFSLSILRRPRMGVNPDPVPRRPAEQFIDRHAQRLPLDVPQGLIDAGQGAGQDGTAAVEGVSIDRLPVMDDLPGVLADQVGRDLLDCLATVSARPSTTGSPSPTMPALVCTLRNSQRGWTRNVSSLVILSGSFCQPVPIPYRSSVRRQIRLASGRRAPDRRMCRPRTERRLLMLSLFIA